MEIERRIVNKPVELRKLDDGRTVIEGYAALYGVLSDDLGGFRERLAPGAFSERLADDVRALWQHDPLYVFGRTVPGTLTLSEDEIGLRYMVIPPDAQWARDAIASIERGDVNQSSFAFTVLDGESWQMEEDGQVVRTISRVARLYDVSPVTYAAYPQTSVSVQQRAADLRARAAGADDDMAQVELTRAREALRLRIDVRQRTNEV